MFRTLVLMLCALALAGPVHALSTRTIANQPLRAQPEPDAATLVNLPKGAVVELLDDRKGIWAQVRYENQSGWIRRLALDLRKQQSTHLAEARQTVEVAGFRELSVRPSAHALIVTNSEYRGEIKKLPGARHDRDNAQLIARAMGVPEDNLTLVSDADLPTLQAALDGLEARVMPNDEVLIYYSGHGGRTLAWDGRADRCAEALVTVEGQTLFDHELATRLQRMAMKARKLIVMLDACHSGGVTTRAVLGSEPERYTGKFWAKSGEPTCERPSNILTRGIGDAKPGQGLQNYVHIAAARNDEVALDDSNHGGLATQAWLECLSGTAQDRDGSGSISVNELQQCAQPVIGSLLKDPRFGAHHITVTGNADLRLKVAEAGEGTGQSVDAVAVLRDIHANRDDRRIVKVNPDKTEYRIGKDRANFTLFSSHAGHVYILMVGSDGKTFDLLFPNKRDTRNHIGAGEVLKLPRPGWALKPGGPAGTDHILAIVSDTPRDFSSIGMRPAGPFSVIESSQSSSKDIVLVTGSSANALKPESECGATGAKRTLEIVEECSDAYGSELISVNEIP